MSKVVSCKSKLLLQTQHFPWIPATSQIFTLATKPISYNPDRISGTKTISITRNGSRNTKRDTYLKSYYHQTNRPARLSDFRNLNLRSDKERTASKSFEDLLVPVNIEPLRGNINIEFEGVENVGPREKGAILERFQFKPVIRELCKEHNITMKIFDKVFKSFREYCIKSDPLDPEVKILFSDIVKQGHSEDQLFVYFLSHARKMYPHLECMKELRSISDLTQPYNWYPLARTIQRRIIFHAGPTNSGKTYAALEAFKQAKSGVYCGPLRLLASEVYRRLNEEGVPCDLVTGDDRKYAIDYMNPVDHLSCTIEMLSTAMRVDCVVIDEVQMLRDPGRGASWTRALLGAAADEIHLCGEKAAVSIVQKLLDPIGEKVEVKEYERKSKLVVSTHALRDILNVQPGDCIVSFSKKYIFNIVRKLEQNNIQTAIIYGDLPPLTKRIMTEKFNDPNDPTKVLVATDAIGMGLNLNIKRIIFTTLVKPPYGEVISASHCRQIAGRAGRFASQYTEGEVMTLQEGDMIILRDKMQVPIEEITRVGIMPGFEQVELFSYYLPRATFVNIMEIFQSIAKISDDFFMSEAFEDQLAVAKILHQYDLPLNARWTFSLAPFNIKGNSIKEMLLRALIDRYVSGKLINAKFIEKLVSWPLKAGNTTLELSKLEIIYDFFDTYLWLSYRLPDIFVDPEKIRSMEIELNLLIAETINNVIHMKEPSFNNNIIENLLAQGDVEGTDGATEEEEMIAVEKEEKIELI